MAPSQSRLHRDRLHALRVPEGTQGTLEGCEAACGDEVMSGKRPLLGLSPHDSFEQRDGWEYLTKNIVRLTLAGQGWAKEAGLWPERDNRKA